MDDPFNTLRVCVALGSGSLDCSLLLCEQLISNYSSICCTLLVCTLVIHVPLNGGVSRLFSSHLSTSCCSFCTSKVLPIWQEFYLELTRAAADNFHHSWRKRHGVVLDGEVASVHYRRGAFDSAAKLYEKVGFAVTLFNQPIARLQREGC